MNIAKIYTNDAINGPGLRLSIFCTGCKRHCEGCYNKSIWDFSKGIPYSSEIKEKIFNEIRNGDYQGVSLLGGDPLEPENQEDVLTFLFDFKSEFPDKNIWLWTGATYNELINPESDYYTEDILEILNLVDVLVDGEYKKELHTNGKYYGSSNQRVINLKEMRENPFILNIENNTGDTNSK